MPSDPIPFPDRPLPQFELCMWCLDEPACDMARVCRMEAHHYPPDSALRLSVTAKACESD